MYKLFLILLISSVLFSCDIRNNGPKIDVPADSTKLTASYSDSTTIEMIDTVFNFGTITDGENVEFSFRFKNTGTNSLIVSSAVASCGCTVPEKPEEPVKPGETGFIKVAFNSQGRVGDTHKEVTVSSNAYPAFPPLHLRGKVVAKN